MFLCRPAKKAEPIYNRVDTEDISLVFKNIKAIKEQVEKAKGGDFIVKHEEAPAGRQQP